MAQASKADAPAAKNATLAAKATEAKPKAAAAAVTQEKKPVVKKGEELPGEEKQPSDNVKRAHFRLHEGQEE